jgi:hypothetical protein
MECVKKLTQAELDALVAGVSYEFKGTMTICVVTLACGFRLVGHSACLNAKDFDEEIGRRVAREHAMEQLWQLEGYHRLRAQEDAALAVSAQRMVNERNSTEAGLAQAARDAATVFPSWPLGFGQALEHLKAGREAHRQGWNGKGMGIFLVYSPDKSMREFLMMRTVEGHHVPWVASQTDLLATDWIIEDRIGEA